MSTNTSFRTALCAQLNASHIGQTVRLSGWVNRRRDHGGVVFIDLRDHTGLAQIVCDPALPALADSAHRLRSEWVLAVSGVVRARPDGTVNTSLASGEIEVMVEELRILNVAATPPFVLDDDNLHEDTPPQPPPHRPAPAGHAGQPTSARAHRPNRASVS